MPDEVLFIDDEKFYARPYVEALEENGFIVHSCFRAEDAAKFLQQNPQIGCIVLDIMMPTPPGVPASETNQGLDTGLYLLSKFADDVTSKRYPVLILTNRNPEAVEQGLGRLGLPEFLVEIRRKIETPAFYLPQALQALLARVRSRESSRDRAKLFGGE